MVERNLLGHVIHAQQQWPDIHDLDSKTQLMIKLWGFFPSSDGQHARGWRS